MNSEWTAKVRLCSTEMYEAGGMISSVCMCSHVRVHANTHMTSEWTAKIWLCSTEMYKAGGMICIVCVCVCALARVCACTDARACGFMRGGGWATILNPTVSHFPMFDTVSNQHLLLPI
jgi:hypothetical protein